MKKAVSLVMALFMALPFFACAKDLKNEYTTVKEDDPWYEATRFTMDPDLEFPGDHEIAGGDIMLAGDSIFSIYTDTSYETYETENILCKYDLEGKLVEKKTLDLTDDQIANGSIEKIIMLGGKQLVFYNGRAEGDFMGNYFVGTLDDNLNVTDKVKLDKMSGTEWQVNGVFATKDYLAVVAQQNNVAVMNRELFIYDSDLDFLSSVEVDQITGSTVIWFDSVLEDSDGNLTINASSNYDYVKITADPGSGDVIDLKETNYFDGEVETTFEMSMEGEKFYIDAGSLWIYSVDGEDYNDFIAFNSFNNVISDFLDERAKAKVLSSNSERTIIDIRKNSSRSAFAEVYDHTFYVLRKADKNPNAGKKIIKLGFYDMIESGTATGIYKFNETGSEYFVKLTTRYTYDPRVEKYCDDVVLTDLMSVSDSPDVIIGISNFRRFKNYLLDLSDIKLSDDEYFTNVTEAMKYDGKLYAMPLEFSMQGLAVSGRIDLGDAKGFTFEEYQKFIDTECNGKNPFSAMQSANTKTGFVFACLDLNEYIGEKADFGKDNFKALLDYAKDNFIEDDFQPEELSEVYVINDEIDVLPAEYTVIFEPADYYRQSGSTFKPCNFMGLPSKNGDGPMAVCGSNFSIADLTALEDGCRELLKLCMNEEILSCSDTITIRKDSTLKIAQDAEKLNEWKVSQYMNHGFNLQSFEDKFMGVTATEYADCYVEMVGRINRVQVVNMEIWTLISEEIQPYFAGDRDYETTVKVLNDRVQKCLDEQSE